MIPNNGIGGDSDWPLYVHNDRQRQGNSSNQKLLSPWYDGMALVALPVMILILMGFVLNDRLIAVIAGAVMGLPIIIGGICDVLMVADCGSALITGLVTVSIHMWFVIGHDITAAADFIMGTILIVDPVCIPVFAGKVRTALVTGFVAIVVDVSFIIGNDVTAVTDLIVGPIAIVHPVGAAMLTGNIRAAFVAGLVAISVFMRFIAGDGLAAVANLAVGSIAIVYPVSFIMVAAGIDNLQGDIRIPGPLHFVTNLVRRCSIRCGHCH